MILGTKNISVKFFLELKKLICRKTLGPKMFGSKPFLDSKNIFMSTIFLESKKNWFTKFIGLNLFLSKNNLGPKYLLGTKIFLGPIFIFLYQNIFLIHTIFFHHQKICGLKDIWQGTPKSSRQRRY